AQLVHAADVHEQSRPRESQPQQRNQRVPAREQLCVVSRAEQLDRLVDGLGDLVVERRRNHVPTSPIARQTRSGVAGISTSVTPRVDNASTISLITAGLGAV